MGCRGGWECVEAPSLLISMLIWINKGFLFCSCLETSGPLPQRQDGTEGNEINPPKKPSEQTVRVKGGVCPNCRSG